MRKTLTQMMEALERRLADRFDRIDARFDAHDRRFDAIDARFDAHDRRFDAIDARLDAHDRRFDAIDTRLGTQDRRLDSIDMRSVTVAQRFDSLEMQVAGVGVEVGELRAEMYGQFDAVYQRFDRLETEYQMLVAGVRRIEERLDDEEPGTPRSRPS